MGRKESLTSAQAEWAAKKQAEHEEEWGAGEKWLSGQFAATASASHEINSAPSAIQHKALNPDKMPVLDEEAMVCCVIAVAVPCDAGGGAGLRHQHTQVLSQIKASYRNARRQDRV